MFRSGSIRRNKRQVDVAGHTARKFDLGFLGCLTQTLYRHLIGRQIHTGLLAETVDQPVNDFLVEVVTAQAVVTGSSKHFLHAIAHFNDGNVERTAAEVIYHDLLIVFFINTVGKCCRCRLVDDTLDLKPCDLTRILRCLTLCIGKVSGNRDNRLGHLVAEISFRILF